MIRRFLCAAIFAGLTACNPLEGVGDGDKARDAIKAMLTDPSSAQFERIKFAGPCITGRVNSRNRMGGYAGFQDFYYRSDTGEAGIGSEGEDTGIGDLDFARAAANTAFMEGAAKCHGATVESLRREYPGLANSM